MSIDAVPHEDEEAAGSPRHSRVLAQAMADVAEKMAAAEGVGATAQVLADTAVVLIPGADTASVSLARRGRGIETIASTDELAMHVDAAQVQTGQGPCIEAAWEDRIVGLPDTEEDRRWPIFSEQIRELGVAGMLSLQLSIMDPEVDERIGALNLSGLRPRGFGRVSEQVALILASHGAVALAGAVRAEQLTEALDSRDVIGQAKGLVMARQGVGAEEAFEALRRQARDSNTLLRDVASDLVRAHTR